MTSPLQQKLKISGPVAAALLAGRPLEAEAALARAISAAPPEPHRVDTVFLVGAGPGDPDLLTLRALHVLQDVDVVFHERGVAPAVLDRARRDAERTCVDHKEAVPRLREAAHAGRRVAYVTRGTPAAEQHEALLAAGLVVISVPGVAEAAACAAVREAA